MSTARLPHTKIGLLGLTTIAVYGAWYYSFGVLLDPIIADTGWRESALTATFSGGGILVGVGAIAGGWLMDRFGSRRVFLTAAVAGGGAILAASYATTLVVFAVLGIIGSGALGGLSFYHITQTAAARIAPGAPATAIARLTIWGALSSPIFLPVAARLVVAYDWRTALRVLVAPAIVLLLASAFWAKVDAPSQPPKQVFRSVLAATKSNVEIRRFLIASALSGMGLAIVLVYQVPLMTSAGLAATLAADIAALRGLSQLLGRVPLGSLLDRVGARLSMQIALLALLAGFLLVLGSGNIVFAIAFALTAGFGIGAISPLQGIYTAELFDSEVLGSAMGLVTVLFASVGALGPAIVGLLADVTGTRMWAVVIGAATAGAGTLILGRRSGTIGANAHKDSG